MHKRTKYIHTYALRTQLIQLFLWGGDGQTHALILYISLKTASVIKDILQHCMSNIQVVSNLITPAATKKIRLRSKVFSLESSNNFGLVVLYHKPN